MEFRPAIRVPSWARYAVLAALGGWLSASCVADEDLFSDVTRRGLANEPPPNGAGGSDTVAPASEPDADRALRDAGGDAGGDAGAISVPAEASREDAGSPRCEALADDDTFEASCVSCTGDDDCAACLCGECAAELDVCSLTQGCLEILSCGRRTGCTGLQCYCGTINLLACGTTGAGNGPCVDEMLAAPGAQTPGILSQSAGPASDAALEVANCRDQRSDCSAACAGN